MEKYFKHLNYCNKMQDWTEAQEALSLCPDDEGKAMAYEEMHQKMNICTCGMEACLKDVKERYFTPRQISEIQEAAYEAGFCASDRGVDSGDM